jgi:hypothetical protein
VSYYLRYFEACAQPSRGPGGVEGRCVGPTRVARRCALPGAPAARLRAVWARRALRPRRSARALPGPPRAGALCGLRRGSTAPGLTPSPRTQAQQSSASACRWLCAAVVRRHARRAARATAAARAGNADQLRGASATVAATPAAAAPTSKPAAPEPASQPASPAQPAALSATAGRAHGGAHHRAGEPEQRVHDGDASASVRNSCFSYRLRPSEHDLRRRFLRRCWRVRAQPAGAGCVGRAARGVFARRSRCVPGSRARSGSRVAAGVRWRCCQHRCCVVPRRCAILPSRPRRVRLPKR